MCHHARSCTQPSTCCAATQALGRAMLQRLENGRFLDEGFLTCRHLSASTEFIVITRMHVLVVKLPHLATSHLAPALTWAAALGDVEHCCLNGSAQIRLTVMRPPLNMLQQHQHMASRALGLKSATLSPWDTFSASLQVRVQFAFQFWLSALCSNA